MTAANVHDIKMLVPMLDAVPAIRTPSGQRRKRPHKLHADRAYQARASQRACRARHIQARIARKGVESKTRLGKHRWVVERSFAWLHRYRRLQVRYDRKQAIHQPFLTLAAAHLTWRAIERFC